MDLRVPWNPLHQKCHYFHNKPPSILPVVKLVHLKQNARLHTFYTSISRFLQLSGRALVARVRTSFCEFESQALCPIWESLPNHLVPLTLGHVTCQYYSILQYEMLQLPYLTTKSRTICTWNYGPLDTFLLWFRARFSFQSSDTWPPAWKEAVTVRLSADGTKGAVARSLSLFFSERSVTQTHKIKTLIKCTTVGRYLVIIPSQKGEGETSSETREMWYSNFVRYVKRNFCSWCKE